MLAARQHFRDEFVPRERKGKALWIIQVRPTPHDSQLLIAALLDFLN